MRVIVDGIAYDTDKATEIVGGDNSQWSGAWWGLYRTPTGAFFKIVVDHDGETLQECRTLTDFEARGCLEKHANHLVEKYFGPMPEPGSPPAQSSVAGRVFISYSKQHPEPTRDIAAYLESQGYSVWWDTNLTSGEIFREVIDQELDAADAVIVIWTADSVDSDWVRSEAQHAVRQNKLIPLRTKDLDVWRIPKPYGELQTGIVDDREAILKAVRRVLGGKNLNRESNSQRDVLSVDDGPLSLGYGDPLHKLFS
jgi:TIR domain